MLVLRWLAAADVFLRYIVNKQGETNKNKQSRGQAMSCRVSIVTS